MSGVGKNPNIPVCRLPQLLLLLWMTEESLDRVRRTGIPSELGFGPVWSWRSVLSHAQLFEGRGQKELCRLNRKWCPDDSVTS